MSCLLQDQHEQWKHHPEKRSRSIKVFRCQLPRNNEFYSTEPPQNNGTDKPLGKAGRIFVYCFITLFFFYWLWYGICYYLKHIIDHLMWMHVFVAPLCSWCGTWKGGKVCSNCKSAHYCSKMHQVVIAMLTYSASNVTWPEYEIVNEDEAEFDTEMSNSDAYGKALPANNEDEGDAKCWASFQKRIARAPDQVLRYSRCDTSKPLWPMLSGQPSKPDIPKCDSCFSDRSFEFQILPQLLYYFDVKNDANSLDWATIVVYTCEASCDGSSAYEEEFAWVQLMPPQSR
ncbi:hypothetical protein OSB04_020180 [Centaurea solstitialis]|uniref:Programmed cell death protein 2 n=1 Tax=Centaurea solstitialis TaxID=347529 RepID=A0AA38W5N3_9ASTR|nr:hypothetical protein OSB04_020180 [Centaurea solstitialis]